METDQSQSNTEQTNAEQPKDEEMKEEGKETEKKVGITKKHNIMIKSCNCKQMQSSR